jgi:hypothetical protein
MTGAGKSPVTAPQRVDLDLIPVLQRTGKQFDGFAEP